MKMSKQIRDAFREFGRQGGKIGGRKRAESLTAEERSAIARKAVQAREDKRKRQPAE